MNAIRKPSCAVPECVKKFIDVQRHFFKFPKEQDRWLQWVRACRRLDLEPKGPEYAHQNCRLCHLHFENKWYKINKVRARLHPDAVPTIFFGPGFQQQDNTAPEQTTQQNEENVVKEKVDRNTCAEATVAEMQVQEDNSKAETSQTIVPIIVSDVEITQPSTSTIKKPAVTTKSSDDSPRKRKLREKFQKLKAQNKVMRETIRRLRMENKKKATKVEEENEFDQLIKLGLLTCLKDE
ncbi:uncharacterized protein LOC143908345 isoform X2 [Temnothorax americanus]|uniref:uncharacterized protein LOC143908345 isoform X2 n=1 Tax=Temnothorax americanus TaxID=1964332 RepID=UPI0040679065